jgi:hypothetical protein
MRVATTAGKVNATEKVDGVKAKLKLTPGKVEDDDRWMQFYVRRSIQNRSLMLIHTQQRYSLEEYEKFEFDAQKLWGQLDADQWTQVAVALLARCKSEKFFNDTSGAMDVAYSSAVRWRLIQLHRTAQKRFKSTFRSDL